MLSGSGFRRRKWRTASVAISWAPIRCVDQCRRDGECRRHLRGLSGAVLNQTTSSTSRTTALSPVPTRQGAVVRGLYRKEGSSLSARRSQGGRILPHHEGDPDDAGLLQFAQG